MIGHFFNLMIMFVGSIVFFTIIQCNLDEITNIIQIAASTKLKTSVFIVEKLHRTMDIRVKKTSETAYKRHDEYKLRLLYDNEQRDVVVSKEVWDKYNAGMFIDATVCLLGKKLIRIDCSES